MPNRRLFIFLFAIVFLVVIAILWKSPTEETLPKAANFEECAAQGNPVMESYPRQCRTKEGVLFVETIIEGK